MGYLHSTNLEQICFICFFHSLKTQSKMSDEVKKDTVEELPTVAAEHAATQDTEEVRNPLDRS